MVLRNAGPVGAPGMPEWGHLPIPAKLLRQGVVELLRISDARMSGTSYGAVVLTWRPSRRSADRWRWCRPATGSGSTSRRERLDVVIDDAELARRRAAWTPPARKDERGYRQLYEEHVLQANEGCDLDFLRGRAPVIAAPSPTSDGRSVRLPRPRRSGHRRRRRHRRGRRAAAESPARGWRTFDSRPPSSTGCSPSTEMRRRSEDVDDAVARIGAELGASTSRCAPPA